MKLRFWFWAMLVNLSFSVYNLAADWVRDGGSSQWTLLWGVAACACLSYIALYWWIEAEKRKLDGRALHEEHGRGIGVVQKVRQDDVAYGPRGETGWLQDTPGAAGAGEQGQAPYADLSNSELALLRDRMTLRPAAFQKVVDTTNRVMDQHPEIEGAANLREGAQDFRASHPVCVNGLTGDRRCLACREADEILAGTQSWISHIELLDACRRRHVEV